MRRSQATKGAAQPAGACTLHYGGRAKARLVRGENRRMVRVSTESGIVVCERCEVPKRALGRMRGLLGRDGLEPGAGMLLRREPSIHTFFMRFPIDVVFFDKTNTVLKVVPNLRPWRAAAARRAAGVLELPAGTAAAAGLRTGVGLVITAVDEPTNS
jgi:uncharacterized protein